MAKIKVIEGFTNYYTISNTGVVCNKKGAMKGGKTTKGYHQIVLSEKGTMHRIHVHKLVADYFIPNPNNHTSINHKDGDKYNNDVTNLEWCTNRFNFEHAVKVGLQKVKAVHRYSLDGDYIDSFERIHWAGKATGIGYQNISAVCRGTRRVAGGYRWSFTKYSKLEEVGE